MLSFLQLLLESLHWLVLWVTVLWVYSMMLLRNWQNATGNHELSKFSKVYVTWWSKSGYCMHFIARQPVQWVSEYSILTSHQQLGYLETEPQFRVSIERLEKGEVNLATLGLVVQYVIHNTTTASVCRLKWMATTVTDIWHRQTFISSWNCVIQVLIYHQLTFLKCKYMLLSIALFFHVVRSTLL